MEYWTKNHYQFDPSLNLLYLIMTDAAEITECALQAADAHVIAHNVWQNGMAFVFCGTDNIELVTYNYYSNWFSRNPSMSHILWQLLLADETW